MLTIDRRRAGVAPDVRVLDLGCGAGRHTFDALRARAAVVALDWSTADVAEVVGMVGAMLEVGEIAHCGFGPLVADAVDLPFDDGTFDVVVASEIFEHLAADRAAIGEVARVLRPGGTLALSVPRAAPERVNWMLSRAYHSVEGGHLRIYRRRALERLLVGAGLAVTGRTYRHGLHTPYWWLRCIVGVDRTDQRLVAAFHRFLVWDMMCAPRLTRGLDFLLNPILGKSLVLYCRKPS
ncbi:MAG TPA: class I SAM-dependent methyltransferase [Acidimicrobiales bacterium]|nr:class I SAM-dependent methyltransferase [Acidimicrobiales bacterium]